MWRPSASITCLALWASSAPSSSAFAPRARRHSRTPALQLLALAPSLDDVAAIASIAGPMIAFGNIVDSAALFSSSSLLDAAAASPSLGGIFESYKTTSTARAQAEADEAAAKKLEAEARRDEARAKLLKAQANSDTQIISQIEKLTSMAEIAERNGDTTTAKMYHAKVAKLNQQLLDS